MAVTLIRDTKGPHKFIAIIQGSGSRGPVSVPFGRKGYSDYTKHKDPERMRRYLVRHKKRENWAKSGKMTAGFWARWILWSRPSLKGAIKQTEKVLGRRIIFRAK
jgi:Family of unknown function (DUF5754)